jgi:hypothetical protein
MDLNLHYMPRSLVARAKSHAASLGITLKEWVIGLVERALGITAAEEISRITVKEIETTLAPRIAKVDADDTLAPEAPREAPKPPSGRRDL